MPCVRGLRTWVGADRVSVLGASWRVRLPAALFDSRVPVYVPCRIRPRSHTTSRDEGGSRADWGRDGKGERAQATHLNLEEVLGRAVDLVKGLLARIRQTGHGLHHGFLEAGDGPLGGSCWARRGRREGRRLVRRCRSAIGARGVVAVRSRFDGIARVLCVFSVCWARRLPPG